MVVDRAGQILAWESDTNLEEMTHLGALLAATYASTREIARILKEDNFRTMLQEGMREKIITETVKDQWLLVVIFDQHAHLGLIKVLTKRTTVVLSNILDLALDRSLSEPGFTSRAMLRATRDTIAIISVSDSEE
jgi:predicted regulator of Ras-like GTPase activity (Roadblock/LC7/MglB family)